MNPLPAEIRHQDRKLKLVKRRGMVALYQLFGPKDRHYGWEVHVIQIRPAGKVFGRDYPMRETSPSNEDWGRVAWSFPNWAEAQARECLKSVVSDPPECPLRMEHGPALDDFTSQQGEDSGEDFNPFTQGL